MTVQKLPTIVFDDALIDLVERNYMPQGSSKEETALFIDVCRRTNLDPRLKQIYAIKTGNRFFTHISIDGARCVAERTGKYAPGKETVFKYDSKEEIVSATVYVRKRTDDGTWHDVAATSFMKEYNSFNPTWKKMPHVMIEKTAEMRALRKAFPDYFGAIYVSEEFDKHEKELVVEEATIEDGVISLPQLENVMEWLEKVPSMKDDIKKGFKIESMSKIPAAKYKALIERFEQTYKALLIEHEPADSLDF